jgi:hypothetical protein
MTQDEIQRHLIYLAGYIKLLADKLDESIQEDAGEVISVIRMNIDSIETKGIL